MEETTREFCADSPYGKQNCPYARVVNEEGEYPVTIMYEETRPDGVKEQVTRSRVDKTAWVVYCKHPNCPKQQPMGSVEPYGGICRVPRDCPLLPKKEGKFSRIIKAIKEIFLE